MNDKSIVDISEQQFPSQAVPDSVKETMAYGLQVGQSIQYEWFRREGGTCRYYNNWRDYHRQRLYARGEQPIGKYKNELSIDGDLSMLNLDWAIVPIMPKFIDVVVNGMNDRMFKVKVYAQDAMSQENRSKYQDMIEGQAAAKDVLLTIKDNTGVDPFTMDPDELPSDDEEMSLHMQLHYKPAIEIAEEEAINTILDYNHYQDTRKRVDYDIATIGIGIVKHEFNMGSGIEVSYVDPANVVYSYTEDPFFKDVFYWGEVKQVNINELYKIKPDITVDEVKKASQYSGAWFSYFSLSSIYDSSVFGRDICTLLYFNYKTTKRVVYKKRLNENGSVKVIEREDTFNPPKEVIEEGRFEVIDKVIDVWYNGVMVMGSNIVLKWELAQNMVRPKSATQHALSNYIACAPRMYKGSIESLGKRMIPFADNIQITHLKLQQVIARTVPDGVFIDADGLNEVDLGNGAAYNPQDALRMYFQTGSVVGRSYTQDGEFNNARVPIQQLTSNSGGSKIQMLITKYNHDIGMIRDVTGLNEAVDGSSPNPDSLVGLQKLAALSSNTATRHILEGSLYIYRSLAEALTYRVSDILEFADFADEFASQIGKYNVSILNEVKDLYLYDFGIFVEVSPDEEEKASLENDIRTALNKNDINLEDAIDIREIKNLKLANQLLKVKRKKMQEREEKMEMQKQALTAQQNMKSQELAAQAAMMKINAEAQVKISVKKYETDSAVTVLREEADLKMMLMGQEFQYNMQLAGVEAKGIETREAIKEKEKARRINQQGNIQSQLTDQKKNNLPPRRFESNEDSLDGLDLAEFEPR